ncbi:MAG: hypothetical protein ACI4K7_11050 [Oscillospiraceae bacterium]
MDENVKNKQLSDEQLEGVGGGQRMPISAKPVELINKLPDELFGKGKNGSETVNSENVQADSELAVDQEIGSPLSGQPNTASLKFWK